MECLFRFYSYGLEKKFRADLFRDFEEETLRDVERDQLYGLEKFWAFLKYYKKAGSLTVDPKVQLKLEKYKTVEDFRVEMVRMCSRVLVTVSFMTITRIFLRKNDDFHQILTFLFTYC